MVLTLTDKKLFASIVMQTLKYFSWFCKINRYLASDAFVASSKPYVGTSPRTKISFILLLTCTDEFISATKIETLLLQLPSSQKNCEQVSNPIP